MEPDRAPAICQISLAWRGRPLTSYDVIIDAIGAVTTRTGLTTTAVLDQNTYPTGTQISGKDCASGVEMLGFGARW